jgi:hypothetical protein
MNKIEKIIYYPSYSIITSLNDNFNDQINYLERFKDTK